MEVMARRPNLPFREIALISLVLCFVNSVDGGECCRTYRGNFWCPDFCCLERYDSRGSPNYPFQYNDRFSCCSDPRLRAPYSYRTTFCSSWFTHSHNLWVPILIAVVVIILLVAFGICCCCIPGFCFCC